LEQAAVMIEEWMRKLVLDLLAQADRSGSTVRSVAEPIAMDRHLAVREAAENLSFGGRLMSLALECHRRGWLPPSWVASLSKPFFRRSLRL
jgi:hypothetical protein